MVAGCTYWTDLHPCFFFFFFFFFYRCCIISPCMCFFLSFRKKIKDKKEKYVKEKVQRVSVVGEKNEPTKKKTAERRSEARNPSCSLSRRRESVCS